MERPYIGTLCNIKALCELPRFERSVHSTLFSSCRLLHSGVDVHAFDGQTVECVVHFDPDSSCVGGKEKASAVPFCAVTRWIITDQGFWALILLNAAKHFPRSYPHFSHLIPLISLLVPLHLIPLKTCVSAVIPQP